ncbi:phage tail protein [Leclercia sp. LSNIH1]|uniref:phage tail protein n=1 Tax=Leclercia sp. LSNIH1 TaxID=1920114 RepID=UPI00267EDE2B
MTAKYYAILTNQGAARLANAAALGTKLNLTQIAVGDANGVLPTPDPSQTALINRRRIAPINLLTVDPNNTSQIIAEQVIPEDEGGWWIREIGLYDSDGVLIAVANCAETYKPQLQEGSGRTQTIRMVLIVSSTAAVTLKIDPSVVLATRQYVEDKVIEVKAYADDVMKKHLASADPHTQYAHADNVTRQLADKQPLDATLTAIAALVGSANKIPYFSGSETAALADLTQVGRDIIGKGDIAAVLAYLKATEGDSCNVVGFVGGDKTSPYLRHKTSDTIVGLATKENLNSLQPLDATLTAIAKLVGSANKMAYFTGADTVGMTDLTQVGRDLIGKSDIAAVLAYLKATEGDDCSVVGFAGGDKTNPYLRHKASDTIVGLATKNNLNSLQPLDATLTAIASLVGTANKLPYFSGTDSAALTDLTKVGRDIIGKSDVAAVLQYLGLGTAAKLNAGSAEGEVITVGSRHGFGLPVQAQPRSVDERNSYYSWYYSSDPAGGYGGAGVELKHNITTGRNSTIGYVATNYINKDTKVVGVVVTQLEGAESWRANFWHTQNTTVDTNGFIKQASPIARLFGNSIEVNDEATGVTFKKISTGRYQVLGSLGLHSEGWQIEIPQDANGNRLCFVEAAYDSESEVLNINVSARKFDSRTGVFIAGEAMDVPDDRWIDLRLDMPEVNEQDPASSEV